ncbi:MAG: OmpA family protein [Roseovarius sp.]
MTRARTSLTLLTATSLLAVTACTDPGQLRMDPNDPNRQTKQGALLGGILGAGVGALTSDNKGRGAVVGGLAGAATGAIAGSFLDQQEADLRRQLENDRIGIRNTGDRLIVTMPQDILFAVDSSTVNSSLRGDLLTVANSLRDYPRSRVQVVGHTDNTGSAAYNQSLSERRAGAVADVLMSGGVSFDRLEAFGRGEDQPVASNLTTEGRAQNRRVEIVILPTS